MKVFFPRRSKVPVGPKVQERPNPYPVKVLVWVGPKVPVPVAVSVRMVPVGSKVWR